MTKRRWMIAAAAVAIICGVVVAIDRRVAFCCRQSMHHSELARRYQQDADWATLKAALAAEDTKVLLENPDTAPSIRERTLRLGPQFVAQKKAEAIRAKAQSDYNGRLARRYRTLASRPWLPLPSDP